MPQRHPTQLRPLVSPSRRQRAARRLDLLAPVPEGRTAAAMDDEREAQQLIDDLVALLDAGLVTPLEGDERGALHGHGARRFCRVGRRVTHVAR